MTLSNLDLVELTGFRRALHQLPELSGEEDNTAKMVRSFLAPLSPDEIITDIGGHGLAVIFNGKTSGPTLLLRCELDGLPITEISELDYTSTNTGKGHLCGHDGHMAIICAVARMLARKRPESGRVVLLFQPAEEIGAGARAIVNDAKFAAIQPDYAFALHNLPGLPLGHVEIRPGPIGCASKGLIVTLRGKTSHAAAPEDGISPRKAMSAIMDVFQGQSEGDLSDEENYALITIVHAKLGEPAFGVSPGEAEIWATLRSVSDERMAKLVATCEAQAMQLAQAHQLEISFEYDDEFVASVNDLDATKLVEAALDLENIPHTLQETPKAFSEDFGLFSHHSKAAMFLLGSGKNYPQLHNPDYDFPDELIAIGSRAFDRLVRTMLG
ncbi:MAG: amidohydrolase [Rhizobiales bacterium]|nr:amidohydrolase [Hyphomicrobiales bacterium]